MLTLSDDLKQYYNLGDAYVGQNVTYSVTINTVNDGDTVSETIYHGQLYYMKPSYLYFKDIIWPYVVDNSWFIPGQNPKFYNGTYEFTVTISFSTGTSYTTDTIRAVTDIPTVSITPIPSILPIFSSDSEFFFAWLCPYDSTSITWSSAVDYMSNTHDITDDPIGHFNCTGSYMITAGLVPYDYSHSSIKSLWVYNRTEPSESKRVAVYDDHSRYFLIWITRDNDYMCRPFCKRYDLKENVSTSYITTYDDRNIPYQKSSEYQWTLNSDWLTYNEHNVYESLMTSQYVYLYDNETGKRYPVNVTDSEWTHKNEQNNKKPFNLTVTVQLNQKQTLIY